MLKRLADHMNVSASWRLASATIAAAIMLIGCDAELMPSGDLTGNTINLDVPQKIRRVSAVNLDAVGAVANVNGVNYEMSRSGSQFQTTITLEPDTTSVGVELRFTETLDSGTVINLAIHPRQTRELVAGNNVMEFFEEDFNTNVFDFDQDGLSNLQERNLGTDPLTFSQIQQTRQLTMRFPLPLNIPEPLDTQAIVIFDGTPRAYSRVGSQIVASGVITTLEDINVEILLTRRIQNQSIRIANSMLTVAAGFDDVSQQLAGSDFDFTRDDDGDGRSNIEEIRAATNPLVAD